MTKYNIGDRVIHKSLGKGTIVDVTLFESVVMVEYDYRPSIEYNMGENPTSELVSFLSKIQ